MKIELEFGHDSDPKFKWFTSTYSDLAGTYILGPGKINKSKAWLTGAYWISEDGKYALWYDNRDNIVVFGYTSDLGKNTGQGSLLSAWSCRDWSKTCQIPYLKGSGMDWQYRTNYGKLKQTKNGVSIKITDKTLKESSKGRCVDCTSCTFRNGCTGCKNLRSGWLPLQ